MKLRHLVAGLAAVVLSMVAAVTSLAAVNDVSFTPSPADHGVSFTARRGLCQYTIVRVQDDSVWHGEWHPAWVSDHPNYPHGVCVWRWQVINYTACRERALAVYGIDVYTIRSHFCGRNALRTESNPDGGGCFPMPSSGTTGATFCRNLMS